MIQKHPLTHELENYDWKDIYEEVWEIPMEEEVPTEGFLIDGDYYKSLQEASKKLGIPYQTLYNWYKHGGKLKIEKL